MPADGLSLFTTPLVPYARMLPPQSHVLTSGVHLPQSLPPVSPSDTHISLGTGLRLPSVLSALWLVYWKQDRSVWP
ncbi:hypothetical protein H920_18987 [Fukomys damarensis]|uniref:Uncharacterized protein n=1 Tax=Fukomys damarensis TaxID=885580 RepID=A0A091DA49_FUKDA|nr:hypothetical protein H920_18987 [Fukomys damarensis]